MDLYAGGTLTSIFRFFVAFFGGTGGKHRAPFKEVIVVGSAGLRVHIVIIGCLREH
jgi:hypothetical protein